MPADGADGADAAAGTDGADAAAAAGRRVAVVGGGVSGLVAARELALGGADVVLFEQQPSLGGRVQRETLAGVPIDLGAEAFATRGGAVAELLAELGLADRVERPAPLGSWIVAAGRALPLPAAGTVGIPAAPLAADTRRALGLPGALRAAIEPLLPRSLGRGGSLGRLVRVRLGARVLDRLVRPVVRGVRSADPDELPISAVPGLEAALQRRGSLVSAARDLRDGRSAAGGAVAGLRDGMGSLVDALDAELRGLGVETRAATGVREIAADAAGGILIRIEHTAAASTELVDAAVLAVPEAVARELLGAPAAGPETRVEVVALAVDDPRLDAAPRGTGALVAAGEHGIRAKALTHVTAKWPRRADALGPGHHLLRLSYGRLGSAPETAGLPDERVREMAVEDASRILGVALDPASVRDMRRREWCNGSAGGSGGGTGSAAGSAAPDLGAPPRVAVTGDWVSGTGLASVVPGARAAARRILDVLAHPRPPLSPALRRRPAMTDRTPATSPRAPRVRRSDVPVEAAPGLIRIGTRGSALAVAQSTTVAEEVSIATGLEAVLVIVTTRGDVSQAPLAQLGGTGVFVSALRDALLDGACDLAVHSLKDLPTGACPGIEIGAIPVRADARDALCARDGLTLAELPEGARVGTGSPRRAAQLLARRSDLDVVDLRGNVDTRLGRVGADLDAVVLACAGLDRLGREAAITERFPLDEAPAAPGQGALAIEVRSEDASRAPYAAALAALDDAESRASALAERAVLATLEAGCAAPVGATAQVVGARLVLRAEVSSLDGTQRLVAEETLPWAAAAAGAAGAGAAAAAGNGAAAAVLETPQRLGETVARRLFEMGAARIAPLGGADPETTSPATTRPETTNRGGSR